MVLIPKDNTKCSECVWSSTLRGDSVVESGYICQLNIFKGVTMGIDGIHSDRKEKKNQKNRDSG